MPLTVAPSETDIQAALRSFLLSVLPDGSSAILGQVNRVPEPEVVNFVTFWPIRRRRITTNVDAFADCEFVASIGPSSTTMVVTAIGANNGVALRNGAQVAGPTVTTGTVIVSQLTGNPGGLGTYKVSPSQTAASQTMAAGGSTYTQQTEVVYQLDVHSANVGDSSNMAQTISTMLRDDYAVQIMQASNANITPLYASDPRQVPFINAEDQYETRWIVEAILQANQTVSGAPAQFADSADVTAVSVEVVPVTGGNSWSDGWSDGFGG